MTTPTAQGPRTEGIAEPRRSPWQRLRESAAFKYAREARENDLGAHLLAISAQQLLCTAPLAVALAAVGKRVTGVSFADILTRVLHLSPRARHEIVAALAGSPHVSLSALLINLAFAVGFGISLAATLQRGLELIWRFPRAPYLSSLARQVCWAVGLPATIALVVLLGRAGHFVGRHAEGAVVAGYVLQIAVMAMFIWVTQYLLLSRRVQFGQLWLPTAISTVAIAVVVIVGRQLVSGQIVPAYRAYGSVGIGIVLSAWVAIASTTASSGLAAGCWLQGRRRAKNAPPVPPMPEQA